MPDDPPSDTPPPRRNARPLGPTHDLHLAGRPTLKQSVKKVMVKAAKTKLKARKSTPAPPTKGNGRKRFVPSPIPEDKQPWKKIDFGEHEEMSDTSPKCKNELFPTSPTLGKGDESFGELENEEADGECIGNCPHAEVEVLNRDIVRFSGQNAGQVAGDDKIDDKGMSPKSRQDKNNVLVAAKANDALSGVRVNLPEMGMGTKVLLESCLVPYQNEETLAVGDMVQPKMTHLLHVASLDSADMLDAMEAQPLLTAGATVTGRPTATLSHPPQPGPNSPLTTLLSAFEAYQKEFATPLRRAG